MIYFDVMRPCIYIYVTGTPSSFAPFIRLDHSGFSKWLRPRFYQRKCLT